MHTHLRPAIGPVLAILASLSPASRRTILSRSTAAAAITLSPQSLPAATVSTEEALEMVRQARRGSGVPVAADPRRVVLDRSNVTEVLLRRGANDMLYPPPMRGVWQCERQVINVAGDTMQAEACWRALGGRGGLDEPEVYLTRFVASPIGAAGVVCDRGFEYVQRSGLHAGAVKWSVSSPDTLLVAFRAGTALSLHVIERTAMPFEREPPFALRFREDVRIVASPTATSGVTVAARARVERRLAPDGDGAIEGTERLDIFRGLDAVSREAPISTIVTRIQLSRPPLEP